MLQLKFNIKGLDRLAAKLDAMDRAAHNLQPALQKVGAWVQRGVNTGFVNQATPDGIGWLALKPETVYRRAQMGFGAGPILRRTGALADSIRLVTHPHSVAVGTDLDYGAAHQTGYAHAMSGKRVPSRKFLGLPPAGLDGAASILIKHLRQTL